MTPKVPILPVVEARPGHRENFTEAESHPRRLATRLASPTTADRMEGEV
jgi:hypothetical protein